MSTLRALAARLVLGVASISALPVATPARADAPAPAPPPLDPAQLQRFFDEYLARQMVEHHVAGVAVYVVKDGQVLFRKGYGLADVEHQVPVDPDRTVFTLGSASKLFTWTAVMQLAEQGKLDLDADVNRYLDFTIPATFPQPITLSHLMAHTAGFEDVRFGQMTTAPDRLVPLGAWLRAHLPARVRPPGQLAAYQNYGAALAGYVVERVSGEPYDDYVERHVLRPLGMGHTSSRAPVPAALRAAEARPYRWDRRRGALRQAPESEVFLNVGPAGAFRSTAGDMARFLVAHLEGGRIGDVALLQPATVERMHRRSFTHDPRLNGMAHGFWELDANGQRILGHAGSHFVFNGLTLLLPERRLGIFLASNSPGGSAFLGEGFSRFVQDFADRFFPEARTPPASPPGFAVRAGRFTGSYALLLGRAETTPEKLFSLPMAVSVQGDAGGLTIALPEGPARFVEAGPLLFRQVDGPAVVAFREGEGGAITHAFLNAIPLTALARSPWWATPAFTLPLVLAAALLFLSAIVAAPVAWLVRRRVGTPPPRRIERAARWIAQALALSGLAVLIGAAATGIDVFGLYVGRAPLWPLVRWLSIAAAALAAATLALAGAAWARRWFGLAGRIHYALLALAGAGVTWFTWCWNVLGRAL